MRKKALLGLLLVLTLLLSSCSLIVKDQALDNAYPVITMGDQVVTKAKVMEEVENQLESQAYMYSMYGLSYDKTDPKNIEDAKTSAIESLKNDMVLTAKAKELGLDQLTEEEKQTAETKAQESWDGAISTAELYYVTDEEKQGKDEAAIKELAEKRLIDMGVTKDTYLETQTRQIIDDKLFDLAVKDVVVTDEEIQADYDSKVEADKATYGEKAGSYADAVNGGTTVYYAPAGVRRVKQILIKFKDEDQSAITAAKAQVTEATSAVTTAQAKVDSAKQILATEGISEETKSLAEADLAAADKELEEANAKLVEANKAQEEATAKAYENIDADTDAVIASLDAGEDWTRLMDEKNQDTGMKNNEKGYAVAADMGNFDAAFVEAAMALQKVGDYSPKTKGIYGYYIIRYDSDEPEGAIALDSVKETISSALLKTKQNTAYTEQVAKWVEEAGIKVDLNALKD